MAAMAMDALQGQIQYFEGQANRIQTQVDTHKLQFTVLNTRLDDIAFTITQLKGFQSQLDGGMHQQSGSQALLHSGTAGIRDSQNAAAIGSDPHVGGSLDQPKETTMSRYTAHHAEFVINWMREETQRYGANKAFIQRLTTDFNKSFGADRSYNAMQGFISRLRKSGQLEPTTTSGESEGAATPTATIETHVGFHTPPATPQKPRDSYVEFIDHCAVLIHTGNDQWYELRCHICGRNASVNGVFFKGWEGVLRHLVKAHDDLDIVEDEDDIDYVLRKCALRQVTLAEIEQIEKGMHKIDKIRKEDQFAAEQVRSSGVVARLQHLEEQDLSNAGGDVEMTIAAAEIDNEELNFECSLCRRASKPTETPEFCPLCGWAVCMTCFTDGSLLTENRPVHYCFANETVESEQQVSTTLTPPELGRWNSEFAATELAPMLDLLDAFCPCTLSGHECKAIICNNKKLCLVRPSAPFPTKKPVC
ncbi:hypothetical protein FKW77_006235 [Venturia effusa]|uniref:Uncharacterized protein n=1 Tax=Venturia effusa TaxID=50376 RepID=A0A517L1G9_9PEZI|nr:hypothetical protein FKW77_006235 [Venturia effusa]